LRAPDSRFTAVDLPEFDRPTKATSRPVSAGKWAGLAALFRKTTVDTGFEDRAVAA
jgi:hypothetical protein